MDPRKALAPKFMIQTLSKQRIYLAMSCAVVVGLQVWNVRGLWRFRDLDSGDTSYYFQDASRFISHHLIPITWTPIYSVPLGIADALTGDAYLANCVVRIAFLLINALLVLVILRAFLGAGIGLAMAAVWTTMPSVYDAVYTVHVAAITLPLAALAVATACRWKYRREVVLLLLIFAFVLARVEYGVLLAAYLLFIAKLAWANRRKQDWSSVVKRVSLFIVAVLLVLVPAVYFADTPVAAIPQKISEKQAFNFCQGYAFYAEQAHGSAFNPWTECTRALDQDFGSHGFSVFEAFDHSRTSATNYVLWNLELIPSGIELALTNRISAGPTPDFIQAKTFPAVGIITGVIIVLSIFGFTLIQRPRRFFCPFALSKNVDVRVLLLGILLMVLLTSLLHRPRPSYLFLAIPIVLAGLGLLLRFVWNSLRFSKTLENTAFVLVITIAIVLPPHYSDAYVNTFTGPGRQLLEQYRSSRNWLQSHPNAKTIVIRSTNPNPDLCRYLLPEILNCTVEGTVPDQLSHTNFSLQ